MKNPLFKYTGPLRVNRGGSWKEDKWDSRVRAFDRGYIYNTRNYQGFRIFRSQEKS